MKSVLYTEQTDSEGARWCALVRGRNNYAGSAVCGIPEVLDVSEGEGVAGRAWRGVCRSRHCDRQPTNGMLVKRPIVVGLDFVLTGFKEADWEAALL